MSGCPHDDGNDIGQRCILCPPTLPAPGGLSQTSIDAQDPALVEESNKSRTLLLSWVHNRTESCAGCGWTIMKNEPHISNIVVDMVAAVLCRRCVKWMGMMLGKGKTEPDPEYEEMLPRPNGEVWSCQLCGNVLVTGETAMRGTATEGFYHTDVWECVKRLGERVTELENPPE